MTERGREFSRTVEELALARAGIERQFHDAVASLHKTVAALREAAQEAERQAASGGLAARQVDITEVPVPEEPAGQQPWPAGGSGWRQVLNRMVRWLFRDYLAVLDRRHEQLVAAQECQRQALRTEADRLETLQQAFEESARVLARAQPRATGEAVREALNRVAESLDQVPGLLETMHRLATAQDAEAVQRAAHGPLAKMELMFEEFSRQQEALLSELVGKRQQLEDLVRRATAAGSE